MSSGKVEDSGNRRSQFTVTSTRHQMEFNSNSPEERQRKINVVKNSKYMNIPIHKEDILKNVFPEKIREREKLLQDLSCAQEKDRIELAKKFDEEFYELIRERSGQLEGVYLQWIEKAKSDPVFKKNLILQFNKFLLKEYRKVLRKNERMDLNGEEERGRQEIKTLEDDAFGDIGVALRSGIAEIIYEQKKKEEAEKPIQETRAESTGNDGTFQAKLKEQKDRQATKGIQ